MRRLLPLLAVLLLSGCGEMSADLFEVQRSGADANANVDRLPSFITGGQQHQPHQGPQQGQNGHDRQGDRFPLHRRRRRHRGPRPDMPGGGGEGGDEPTRGD